MCFSATACFTAAAILIPTGVYTLNKSCRGDKRYLALASFPLLFGIQQITEGALWLSFEQRAGFSIDMAAMGFLFFAYFLWPFFVPLAALLVETKTSRRTLFKGFTIIGFLFGASLYIPLLINQDWLSVTTVKGSILYESTLIYDGIIPRTTLRIVYAVIVAVPLLFSTVNSLRIFGALIFISVTISAALFAYAFVSIWCFFAAILSAFVVYIIHHEAKHPPKS